MAVSYNQCWTSLIAAYRKIIKRLVLEEELFEDTEFKPNSKSLYLPGYESPTKIKWFRGTKHIENSRLFSYNLVSNRVSQGAFGTWSLTVQKAYQKAAKFLALHPHIFQKVIPDAKPTHVDSLLYQQNQGRMP
jgi:Calpain family cysteine protease